MVYTSQQLYIGAVCIAGTLLFVALFPGRRRNSRPYERVQSILTPAERHFYKVLSGHAIIMAKVRIADVLKVKLTISR